MAIHRNEVMLVNLMNGYRDKITVYDDPDMGYMSYIEHSDLLSWAERAGCQSLVYDMWHGKVIDSFLGFEDDDCRAGVMIYQNKSGRRYVSTTDKRAFEAIRVTGRNNRFGDHPNMIPRNGK